MYTHSILRNYKYALSEEENNESIIYINKGMRIYCFKNACLIIQLVFKKKKNSDSARCVREWVHGQCGHVNKTCLVCSSTGKNGIKKVYI